MSNFLIKIWDDIISFFTGKQIQAIGSRANELVNAFKKLDESTVGQFLETTLQDIYPPATGILDAIHIAIPQILIDLKLVTGADSGKNNATVILEGLTALNDLKAKDPILYAGTLGTISQKIQTIEAGAIGVALTSDQAAVNAIISHDPEVVKYA